MLLVKRRNLFMSLGVVILLYIGAHTVIFCISRALWRPARVIKMMSHFMAPTTNRVERQTNDQEFKTERDFKQDLETFANLNQEYQDNLSNFSVPRYKDTKTFITYGPPVGEFISKGDNKGFSNKTKIILAWTTFYKEKDWGFDTICRGINFSCVVSTNKSDLLKSDAVLFHPLDMKDFQESLPWQRLPRQRWVYFVQEPPYFIRHYTKRGFRIYNNIFNWTITYRWDSDFPLIFTNITKLEKPLSDRKYQDIFKNIISKKTKLLAIMHSNCQPQSPRFKVLAEIQRYFNVDFYGQCGNLTCPRFAAECNTKMSAYKFYLAFENSECRDYVTEKVVPPLLDWESVPIVLGALPQDYARALPPNSYIHVKGFKSIKKLVDYITLLDNNPELYEKYHSWRKAYSPLYLSPTYCNMCKALFDTSRPVQTYRDFASWYRQDICR